MTSHREQLESLRDVLWSSIQEVDPDKRAPLANQYRAVLQELEALSAANAKAGDPVDEIAARRSARGGATARARRTAGSPS